MKSGEKNEHHSSDRGRPRELPDRGPLEQVGVPGHRRGRRQLRVVAPSKRSIRGSRNNRLCRERAGKPGTAPFAKKNCAAVPSILLASNASIEMYLKALSLGVFEYLNKPIKTEELIRTVKTALEKTRFLTK
jgi:hypothetical protein